LFSSIPYIFDYSLKNYSFRLHLNDTCAQCFVSFLFFIPFLRIFEIFNDFRRESFYKPCLSFFFTETFTHILFLNCWTLGSSRGCSRFSCWFSWSFLFLFFLLWQRFSYWSLLFFHLLIISCCWLCKASRRAFLRSTRWGRSTKSIFTQVVKIVTFFWYRNVIRIIRPSSTNRLIIQISHFCWFNRSLIILNCRFCFFLLS
jgi:hypothetical protein